MSFGLSACASLQVPVGEAKQPIQLLNQPVFKASDGTLLYGNHWQPEGKARAHILLFHGFNEYAGAFDQVGKRFAKQGIAMWAFDQRGFGRSPYRGLWSSAERMAQDAREMTRLLRSTYPDTPLYVMGMSMGGAVSLLAAGRNTGLAADGLILEAPAVWTRATQPFYQRWALDFTLKFTPGWSPSGEGLKIQASDNIAMLTALGRDPWMLRKARVDTLAGLVDLMDKGFEAADEIKLPTLLLYGQKDELVPERPINLLWERLPKTSNTQQIRYENGWHMLSRDLQGDKVISDIVAWIERGSRKEKRLAK
ncbi:alpha/beta hydrolase [Thiolinea disciformis]|uniref:alpha/beta hydrolase n=1 Tax=Thiolinea disciformis TaxID=125614 RepID=UPI000371C8D0|nr:alpha/beta hydrolase [Thiolinea disciformis]